MGPLRRSSRRPGYLLAAFMLMASGGIFGYRLLGAAAAHEQVLVVARPVLAGDVVQAADLRVAEVWLEPGIAALAASQAEALVGMTARVNLVPGSVIAAGQVGDSTGPPQGQVLMVVSLPASRLPATGLHPGDHVLVIPATTDPEALGRVPSATPAVVVRVGSAGATDLIPVDVHVAAVVGTALAPQAAKGEVTLVVQAAGQG